MKNAIHVHTIKTPKGKVLLNSCIRAIRHNERLQQTCQSHTNSGMHDKQGLP